MHEVITQTAENWNREGLVVGRVGFAAIRSITIGPELEGPGSPYTRLAEAYYDEFIARIPFTRVASDDKDEETMRLHTRKWAESASSILAGYHATGALLGYSTWAYITHHQEAGIEIDPEELRSTLKDPNNRDRLLTWFADVPNSVNRIREEHFGIRAGGYEGNRKYKENPFFGEPNPKTGNIQIQLDKNLLFEALRMEVITQPEEYEASDYARCPMTHTLLPALWNAMADNICDNLTYFEPEAALGPSAVAQVE